MKDSIGKRVATETPKVVIRRSFKSKFISILGFWPWVVLFIMDLLGVDAVSSLFGEGKNYVICIAIAVVDFLLFLLIAYLRSRMITYVNTDTLVYIPSGNPKDIKARSFVDACKEGGKAPVPSSEIIYNQAILDGIVRSNAIGREITIEIPEI